MSRHMTDTLAHIYRVRDLLYATANELILRGHAHDASKLVDPERGAFEAAKPALEGAEYGTHEYKQALDALGPALKHHYQHNRHHPEHFEDGVNGMTLVDLMEMVCDWAVASQERGRDPRELLGAHGARFKIEPQLLDVIRNTLDELVGP